MTSHTRIPIQPAGALPSGFLPRGCTYSPEDWRILARHWYPVSRLIDIKAEPLAVTLLDLPLVVYRAGGQIVVARDLCPHRGVPLSMGHVEGEEIVCAYHGLRYGPDGRCRKIPAHPDLTPSTKFTVSTFPAVERYGLLWTCLTPDSLDGVGNTTNGADLADANAPASALASAGTSTGSSTLAAVIPPMPTWDDPAYQPILPPYVDIAAAPGRQVEGFIDVAHFAFVHHESFADRDNPVVPQYHTETTDFGLRTEYTSSVSNYPKGLQHLAPADFPWLRVFEIYPPFSAQLTVHFPDAGRLNILNAACPVSARKTRLFVPLTRNFGMDGPLESVYAFNAQIFAEDQAIVERQCPEDLPLEMDAEAHFAADRSSVGYRRLLRDLGLSSAQSR
jgi:vanillate O-demethylase monooxygenase subunit